MPTELRETALRTGTAWRTTLTHVRLLRKSASIALDGLNPAAKATSRDRNVCRSNQVCDADIVQVLGEIFGNEPTMTVVWFVFAA